MREYDTLQKVAKDMEGEFRTNYNSENLHTSIEVNEPDRYGQHPRVDVLFNEGRGVFDVWSDYHHEALVPQDDDDIDSETIERTVRDFIQKDYK